MNQQPITVVLQKSPSIINDNLSLFGNNFSYVHLSSVYNVSLPDFLFGGHARDNEEKTAQSFLSSSEHPVLNSPLKYSKELKLKDNGPITGLEWISFHEYNFHILVVTCCNGVQFFSHDNGNIQYFSSLPLPDTTIELPQWKERYLNGISLLKIDGSYSIAIGSSWGFVFLISLLNLTDHRSKINIQAKFSNHLHAHHNAIVCCIATDTNNLENWATGDEFGNLVLWHKLKKYWKVETGNFPIISIRIHCGQIIIAGANGLIHIYDSLKKFKLIEIAAHTRLITGLTVDWKQKMFVSIAEDSCIQVFSFSLDEGNLISNIQQIWAKHEKGAVYVGAQFYKDSIVFLEYDNLEMTIVKLRHYL